MMDGTEKTGNTMQIFKSPNRCSSSSSSSLSPVAKTQTQMEFGVENASSLSPEDSKRPGIPPSHPTSSQFTGSRSVAQKPTSLNLNPKPSHSTSLSHPEVFSFECLRLSSPLPSEPMEQPVNGFPVGQILQPPRKGHRRSNSDTPLGFSDMIQSSPQLIPIGAREPIQVNQGFESNREDLNERKCEGEVVDALLSEYMNFESVDRLNSSCTEDKDLDNKKAGGSKINGGDSSDNEVESRVNGGGIAPAGRHYRSVSMDSFMGNLNFADQSPKLPFSVGTPVGQQQPPSNSMDGNSIKFNLEIGNSGFSAAELEKIMASEKLAEIALSEPKRAKRILANRLSAARSKERKNQHAAELEHKVKILETETATLSARVTTLQREAAGLSNQNNELKLRLQAKEQHAQLKDSLNEALSTEVQHLKLIVADLSREANFSNRMRQQISFNHQMFQPPLQQQTHLNNVYQLQQQQQQQHQREPPQLQYSQSRSQQQNGEASSHQLNQ